MKYQPITCVWEVTMGCNMRCKHCGSSCAEPLPDELTTEEALNVCDQIGDLGLRWVTLSGGEPLIRKDIDLLVDHLHKNGVIVNLITNGWLINEALAKRLKASGISTLAISIDGTEELHDSIRKPGAFAHAKQAFHILNEVGIKTGAITTISNQNFYRLREIKEALIEMGVHTWQVQIGLPMGNFNQQPDWLIKPEKVDRILDFCYETAVEGRIRIYPADCIGYYTKREQIVKQLSYRRSVSEWSGCNAGVRSFGILHNGEILGCTSIRNREYIEGSLREKTLREIWESNDTFLWRRQLQKNQLKGECQVCRHASKCLGGCPNTRLTIKKSIYEDNPYCSYHQKLVKLRKKYEILTDKEQIVELADFALHTGNYQEATFAYARAITLDPTNNYLYKAKAYCEYQCENYECCKQDNEHSLTLDPNDPYTLNAYGIVLSKLGNKEIGLEYVKKAAKLTHYENADIVHDLNELERVIS